MSGHLLDVNVLIALIDPSHVQHDRAHEWFVREGQRGWLSCPTTQNGVLRIVSHPKYSNAQSSPTVVAQSLQSLLAVGAHRFVPDDISLVENPAVSLPAIVSSAQVTDTYLLALAHRHAAKLATFDRRLVTTAVRSGTRHLHVLS